MLRLRIRPIIMVNQNSAKPVLLCLDTATQRTPSKRDPYAISEIVLRTLPRKLSLLPLRGSPLFSNPGGTTTRSQRSAFLHDQYLPTKRSWLYPNPSQLFYLGSTAPPRKSL